MKPFSQMSHMKGLFAEMDDDDGIISVFLQRRQHNSPLIGMDAVVPDEVGASCEGLCAVLVVAGEVLWLCALGRSAG